MSSVGSQRRRGVAALAAVGLFGGLLTVAGVASPTVSAAPTVIASDLTDGPSLNLTSYSNAAPPFSNPGDGFGIYQRGVPPEIPFSLADDSLTIFPGDTLGIVDENNVNRFFGVTDTVNDDNPNADPVSATWVFDISGGTDLSLSIDMGAMGDFEASDTFVWTYAIDGGAVATAFASSVDEASSRTYTLADGDSFTLDDPMNVGAAQLSNVLQPVATALSGTGSELTLTLTASTDGGTEAFAFQNIQIISDSNSGGDGPALGDLVITEIMQNPAAVADGVGEWFEIANVSTSSVDLDGWTISDDDSDSHVIAASLVIPAGGYAVLGNNSDSGTNGGVAVDYQYTGIALANGADEVVLSDPDGVEFDRVEYDGGPAFPDPTGASMGLDPALTEDDNNDGANWCIASSPLLGGDSGTPGAENDSCAVPPPSVFIHQVQGSGSAVAITGTVAVEAVVTSLFTRDDVLDGFFLQEEDADADLDPATSEGIFVFCRGACPGSLAVGDLVAVTGDAEEFFGMSQIDASGGSISTISSGNPIPSPSPVLLPASGSTLAEGTFEPLEGMVVTFPNELVVSEYFQLARFGQVVLTETSRPAQFTQTDLPSVTGYNAFLDDLATRRIILDDDNNDNNDAISDGPDEPYAYPGGGLSLTNRFRGGDTIEGLTGVLHWSFAGSSGTDAWRVRPIQLTGSEDLYTFDPANPAPPAPDAVGGSLTVASFNVLNYFASIDDGIGTCAPSGTEECRGADSTSELDRQRDKIVDALATIDGDIVGLIELENDGDDASIADLVAGLNARVGAGTYDYVETGFIGDDAIKVGLIYQPANVTPYNDFAILDSSVDPTFDDMLNRPMLVQTFVENASGERVTVAVNHLKSKGSACDGVGDPDLGDGQGNCSATRTAAASAIAGYLASDPTGSGDPDSIVLGDLNSYAMEDPIRALESEGYTDLLEAFGASGAYSYLFDGQLGTLDYAMANSSLSDQVTGATAWNINADEIPVFDYNDEIEDSGEASFERESDALAIFAPDALRSSDHDPVIVGLALDSIPDDPTCHGEAATIVGTPGDDVIDGGNGKDVIVTFGGHDTVTGGNGKDVICTGFGDDVIDGGNGMDLLDGGEGNDVIDGGNGRDTCLAGESLVACEIS